MPNTWPTADSFPQYPLADSAIEEDPEIALRTPMEVGPPKVRLRATTGYERHQYTFVMTATNKAAMKTFYGSTCSRGAETFEWDHPETAVTEEWRFIAPPQYRLVGPSKYHCLVQMEMLP